MSTTSIKTLGELKASGYEFKTVTEELRVNLSQKLQSGEKVFENIIGYDDTVIPELERAVLAGHSINFLGLRGQGKTKIARLLVQLLDEYVPVIKGSALNEDPLFPLTTASKKLVAEKGDDTPVTWWHRSERYAEKLATPDVNIADLVGDIDPIKAANLKLSLSDEEVINYGIIPRSNRGIFVINELPDLQPRIQVALFNLLQEGDLQIRGYKVRIPMDVQFVFTSNPEDYTNRGSIITPLKDRIQSQIYTHYPISNLIGRTITKQEVKRQKGQENIFVPEVIEKLIEQVAIEARGSEFIDAKSGVSARLPISAYENVLSAVERRMLINGDEKGIARIGDLTATIPAIIGKIEMVYEGEQEGASNIARRLINQAIRSIAPEYFNNIQHLSDKRAPVELKEKFMLITSWFESGQRLDLLNEMTQSDFENEINNVSGLEEKVEGLTSVNSEKSVLKEFLLTALAAYSLLERKDLKQSVSFQDYFSSVVGGLG
ncbi:MAG: sigma 54-interacting transcriptional regulator [Flavobacteriales bacterium]|nr:sigma 54-interacting transcriptional regulator [Flavobacteriales bacterium]|tara:strand:+ start:308 stop:1777 length:1470 start_codon:yes stop_codon:yes gene_type:complete